MWKSLGGRTLAYCTFSQGYYWLTMKKDVESYVKKCDQCQRYTSIPCISFECLNPVTSSWLFAQWRIDVVDPLPTSATWKKLLLVATNYFSKWVETETYAIIKDKDVSKFMWKNIMCRFGIP